MMGILFSHSLSYFLEAAFFIHLGARFTVNMPTDPFVSVSLATGILPNLA